MFTVCSEARRGERKGCSGEMQLRWGSGLRLLHEMGFVFVFVACFFGCTIRMSNVILWFRRVAVAM